MNKFLVIHEPENQHTQVVEGVPLGESPNLQYSQGPGNEAKEFVILIQYMVILQPMF